MILVKYFQACERLELPATHLSEYANALNFIWWRESSQTRSIDVRVCTVHFQRLTAQNYPQMLWNIQDISATILFTYNTAFTRVPGCNAMKKNIFEIFDINFNIFSLYLNVQLVDRKTGWWMGTYIWNEDLLRVSSIYSNFENFPTSCCQCASAAMVMANSAN